MTRVRIVELIAHLVHQRELRLELLTVRLEFRRKPLLCAGDGLRLRQPLLKKSSQFIQVIEERVTLIGILEEIEG